MPRRSIDSAMNKGLAMLIAHLRLATYSVLFAQNRWPGGWGSWRRRCSAASSRTSIWSISILSMAAEPITTPTSRTGRSWAGAGLVALSVAKWRDPPYLAAGRRLLFRRNDTTLILDSVASPIMWLMPLTGGVPRTRRPFRRLSSPGHELHVALDFCPRTSDMRLGAGPRISTIAARRGHA